MKKYIFLMILFLMTFSVNLRSARAQWTGQFYSGYGSGIGIGYGTLSFGMGYNYGYGGFSPYYSLGGYYPYYGWGYSSYPGDFIYEPVPQYYHQSLIPLIEKQIEQKQAIYYQQKEEAAQKSPPPASPEILDRTQPESRQDAPSPQETVVIDNGTVTINSY